MRVSQSMWTPGSTAVLRGVLADLDPEVRVLPGFLRLRTDRLDHGQQLLAVDEPALHEQTDETVDHGVRLVEALGRLREGAVGELVAALDLPLELVQRFCHPHDPNPVRR